MGSKPCRPVVSFEAACERLDTSSFEQLRRDFVRLATPGTDRIPKEDFIQHAGRLFPGCERLVHTRLFDAFDTDGSGAVDMKEFVAGMFCLHHGTEAERLQLVFNMFDLESNGIVTRKDMKRIAVAFAVGEVPDYWVFPADAAGDSVRVRAKDLKPLLDAMVEAALAEHDADKDGRLCFREWCSYAAHSDAVREFLAHLKHADPALDAWDSQA